MKAAQKGAKKEHERTTINKAKFLNALRSTLGNITVAAKATKIPRQTHQYWMNTDPIYHDEAMDIITNESLDTVEWFLYKAMKEGNVTAILAYLNAKGSARGYGNKKQLEVTHKGLDVANLTDEELIAKVKELTSNGNQEA